MTAIKIAIVCFSAVAAAVVECWLMCRDLISAAWSVLIVADLRRKNGIAHRAPRRLSEAEAAK